MADPVLLLINGLAIDAFLSEEHVREAEATQYPVEQGSDITDHVHLRPVMLTVEGVVSDAPLSPIVEATRQEGLAPSEEARLRLEDTFDLRQPITIVTARVTLEDMIMTSLSATLDSSTGAAYVFRATFQKLRLVENRRVQVKVAVPRAKKKVDLGTKPPTPTEGATEPPEDSLWGEDHWYYGIPGGEALRATDYLGEWMSRDPAVAEQIIKEANAASTKDPITYFAEDWLGL